jgi:hypothetical protein
VNKAENLALIRADYGCVCDDPENFCGGADIDPDEPGYCAACAALDGEEHCLVCPFECCAQPALIDGGES